MAIQTAIQAFTASPHRAACPSQRSRKTISVSCAGQSSQRRNVSTDMGNSLMAGLAAAALTFGVPSAEAGVVLVQPVVKNYVKDTPAKASSGSTTAAPKRSPAPAETSEGFDFKPLVLPLSLVAVAAGGFALTKVDPGFAEMMQEAGTKDSRSYAGYETGLKDTPFFGGNGSIPTSVSGGAKAAPKKSAKKGGFFGR